MQRSCLPNAGFAPLLIQGTRVHRLAKRSSDAQLGRVPRSLATLAPLRQSTAVLAHGRRSNRMHGMATQVVILHQP